jgi:hypothetical protein
MKRPIPSRRLAPLALALGLALGVAPAPSLAQEPAPAEGTGEESSGRSLDGYFATGALAFLVLFIVGKSARR